MICFLICLVFLIILINLNKIYNIKKKSYLTGAYYFLAYDCRKANFVQNSKIKKLSFGIDEIHVERKY